MFENGTIKIFIVHNHTEIKRSLFEIMTFVEIRLANTQAHWSFIQTFTVFLKSGGTKNVTTLRSSEEQRCNAVILVIFNFTMYYVT